MKYLIDTFAWCEAFAGTKKGAKVRDIIENERNTIIVADSTFAELYSWAVRKKHDPGFVIKATRDVATVFEIYTNIWVEAADFKERQRAVQRDFGQMDALLLAIQKHTGATIVTGDKHFKNLDNVMML